jgi:hypothetical protein
MAMANSSYARAAGIQSEINKVTVTRVASSEVECKRQTSVYKKDMIITINNISREQRLLRESMIRYSKKKKQHKLVKEKREKEILERERKKREHLEEWEQIHAYLNSKNGVSEENTVTNGNDESDVKLDENGKPIDDVQISDENNNETTDNKSKRTRKENINSELEETNQNLNPFDVLPSIKESENEQEVNLEQERITPDDKTESTPSTSDTTQQVSEDTSLSPLSPLFALTLRPLKPRKQVVSFSDIIKLKHSHNTNKLFDMVHVLAQKHGVNESVEKRRAERRNSRIPKGSTDVVISESLRKAASVIYPMKYGYGDHESNNKEKFDFYDEQLVPETTDISIEPQFSEKSGKVSSKATPPTTKMKRNKSISGFNEDLKKFRKEEMMRKVMTEERRRFTHVSSRSMSSKHLPSINSSKSSPNHSRSNSVSWTEAFGLLKIVHSIE